MKPHTSEDPLLWLRRLKLRHLELFLVLDSSGSLTAAAQRLHITQSGMSHWLSELEAATGTRLVERGRQIRLTPAGEALRRFALRVVGDATRTHAELASIASGAPVPLRIATLNAGVVYLVPKAITAFHRSHPEVPVDMVDGRLAQLIEELGRRELDVVVRSMDARTDVPELMREVLFEDHMVPIVGTSHPLTQCQSRIAWSHLMAYPWIAPPSGTRMRINLDRVMAENGCALTPRVTTGSISVMQSLLQQDNHVSACSVMLAAYLEARGEVHVLPLSAPFGPVGAVFRERDQHPQLQAFLSSLREQVNAYPQSRLATSTA